MGDNDDADPVQDQEWLRESDLINGGLILIGVYLVQPFLTALDNLAAVDAVDIEDGRPVQRPERTSQVTVRSGS